ncbi:MAG: hypothetical protein R3Y06_09680 [Faecalibacterium sp.]
MDQLPENMRVLRLFGAEQSALDALLSSAEQSKGIHMDCMQQGSEALLLLEAETRSGSATLAVLNAWQEQVAEKCGAALYAKGEATLTQTMVHVFTKKGKLFSCVDAQSSALIESKLGGIKQVDAIYDFGAHSHAHPKFGRKIAMGSKFAQKYPDQTAQQIAGKLKATYQYSGADFALAMLPREDGSHLILVGEKAGYWLRYVPATENAVLWAVDILRRAALAASQADGTLHLAYGAALPAFAATTDGAQQGGSPQGAEAAATAATSYTPQEDLPAPQPANGAVGKVFLALALVLLVVLATVAVLYSYTGGDIASLWYSSEFTRFSVSSATLV